MMMVLTPKINRHMNPEEIEDYSMGDLPESMAPAFEEHLLLCEMCRDGVTEADRFARSVQLAGEQMRRVPKP